MTETKDQEPISNTFMGVLSQQRKGKCLNDLSAKLAETVLAVREHGQSATLVLTITLTPRGDEAGSVSVTDEIKTKLPKPKLPSSLFYTNDDGSLSRDNPEQRKLEFEALPEPGQKSAIA